MRSPATLLLAAAISLTSAGAAPAAEIIDRVLAAVGGQIITLSDVRAALRLGLVPPDVSEDPVAAALQRLIDRTLMQTEVERYVPPEPDPAAVDAGVAAVRARFADAAAFDAVLKETAMSHDKLRRHVRDTLRLQVYLQQRFGSLADPSDDEVMRYYRENSAEFTVDGRVRPFEQVRETARATLTERSREAFLREWVEGLRRRSNVVVLYLPAAR